MGGAIVVRYWVHRDYDAVLVGLDDTTARRICMVAHMSLGAVCMLIGPLQFWTALRKRPSWCHRWMGRLYVVAAVACALFGLVFIGLKRFVLVGGINMGVAFFVAGTTFGVCAVVAAVHARAQQWTQHCNWAIRSYSQILSPVLYRYFYMILGGLRLYPETDIECNEQDICHPFTRVFDMIHAWTYFVMPLVVAEVIIRASNPNKTNPGQHDHVDDDDKNRDGQKLAVVKESSSSSCADNNNKHNQDDDDDDDDDDAMVHNNYIINDNNKKDVEAPSWSPSLLPLDYRQLNQLGVVGAVVCTVSTLLIYVTSFVGTNTVAT